MNNLEYLFLQMPFFLILMFSFQVPFLNTHIFLKNIYIIIGYNSIVKKNKKILILGESSVSHLVIIRPFCE